MARKKKEPEIKKIVRRKITGKFSRKENGKRVVYGPGSIVEFDPYDDLPEAFDDDSWELISGKKLTFAEVLADVVDPILEDSEKEEEQESPDEEEEDKFENLKVLFKGNGKYDVINTVTEKKLNNTLLTKQEAEALVETYREDE